MAAVSPETQEILDRLKKEGELLRNRGKHSIKSVKIDMSKFEGVFDTIALNLAEQTEILRESLGIERDRVAEEMRRRDLADVKSVAAAKLDVPEPAGAPEKNGGVLKLLSTVLGSVAGGIGKLAIGGAIGIAGGVALYQFAKGFINEKAGDPNFVDNFLDDTIQAIKDFKGQVIARAPSVIGGTLDTMEKVKGQMSGFGQSIQDFGETVEEIDTFLNNKKEQIGNRIEDSVQSYDNLKTQVTDTITSATDATGQAIERITGEEGVISKVEDFIEDTTQDVSGIVVEAKTAVSTLSSSLIDTSGTLDNVNSLFKNVDFEGLRATFGRLSTELPAAANKILDFFSNPLAAILPPLTAGLITGAVANQTGKAIMGLKADYKGDKKINPALNLKTAIIGAVGLGIGIFGNRLKEWITSDEALGNVDIAGVNVGDVVSSGISVLGGIAQGATLGRFFGAKGMIVGAVIGGLLSLGQQLYRWFQRKIAEWRAEAARETQGGVDVSQIGTTNPTNRVTTTMLTDYQTAQKQLAALNARGKDTSGIEQRIRALETQAAAQGMTFITQGGNVTLQQNNTGGSTNVNTESNVGINNAGAPGQVPYPTQ